VWKEYSDNIGDGFKYKRDGSNKYFTNIEKCVEEQINISITNLVSTYTISNNTKLEVLKELYMYRSKTSIYSISNEYYSNRINALTGISLEEAKDIVDVWKEEYIATTKEV
jgi:hypothetical protein